MDARDEPGHDSRRERRALWLPVLDREKQLPGALCPDIKL
jgi:hypothetical protein